MSLQERYKSGDMKPGFSEEVDQAIADIEDWLSIHEGRKAPTPSTTLHEVSFEVLWTNFLSAVVKNFPNISPYNICGLESSVQERANEHLFTTYLRTELTPYSWEAHCFLGHTYRERGDLDSAIRCYQKAFDLAMERVKSDSDPLLMDAADYLRHQSDCLRRKGKYTESLVGLIKSLSLAKRAESRRQIEAVEESIASIQREMRWAPREKEPVRNHNH